MAIIGKPITLGGKGGGTFPTIAVSAETGATITATNGNESISFDEVDSGLYVGYPTDYGTWTVTAVSGSRGATATVEVTEVMLYSISMTLFGATLAITAPSGATVTVVDPNGTTVNTHTATGIVVNVTVYSAGTYTITAVDGADEASTTATVSTDGESVQVNVQFFVNPLNTDLMLLGDKTVYFNAYPEIKWQVQHVDGDYVYLALFPMLKESVFGSSSIYSGSTIASECTSFLNDMIPNIASYLELVTVESVTSKVFIPSYSQLISDWDWPKQSASNRICRYNGTNYSYWTSSYYRSGSAWSVTSFGVFSNNLSDNRDGFRPAVKVRYRA